MAEADPAPPASACGRTLRVAVVGQPNAGKSSLFNALTGARQKVGNYPGVTVERLSAELVLPSGARADLIDLPGTYSLDPRSPDEAVTRDVLLGRLPGEAAPDMLLLVLDATNLAVHLRLALELLALGLPTVVALNRIDMARRDGLAIDREALARRLGVPVVETVAVRRRGLDELRAALEAAATLQRLPSAPTAPGPAGTDRRALARAARTLAADVTTGETRARQLGRQLDSIILHPLAGPMILAGLMFLLFQAVFALAETPMSWIEAAIALGQQQLAASLPDGPLRGFLTDGLLGGVGAVIVFLPQILILFAFILLLEGSGYMVRAAFLMDRLMARIGLDGRAFIPLLSAFACAVPAIMATRALPDARDRLLTMMIAPLMTCSARLPVYAVVIAAFVPARPLWGPIGLQGFVLFALYAAGILGAIGLALLLRRTAFRGHRTGLLVEMPAWQWPALRDVGIGLWLRALAFLKRAGTIILAVTVALWALASFPVAPPGANQLAHSMAGRIGAAIEPLVRPLGFGPDIAIALVPAMAAREVAVAALGTVHAIEADADDATGLVERLRSAWPLPTALAFLAWFVFAPQCLSTLAVMRRETGGWRWPAIQFALMIAMAWVAAFLTFRLASALA
ncbi:MAG: ferrous iron transporter B [Sphingomonadaceae bacterium]